MKLIGAAVQRTGTMSTQAALEILGFKAYHMAEAVINYDKGHLDQWNALFEGTGTPDWEQLLGDYDSTTDNPSCFFYKELMDEYPDALVLLNQRDPEKWCNSMEKILEVEDMIGKKLSFLPRFKETHRLFINSQKNFFGADRSRENLISNYLRFQEEVKATVPPERLLIFNVKQGWEPLCNFLGVPIPDEPFPHLNKASDVDKTVMKILIPLVLKDLLKVGWPIILGIAVLVVLLLLIL